LTDLGLSNARDDAGNPDDGTTPRRPMHGASPPRPARSVNVTVEEVRPIVDVLKRAFGLELFGFDILMGSEDREWLVVDVNYFPSYKEVPNFPSLLAQYLTQRVLEQRRRSRTATVMPSTSKDDDDDDGSGFPR
jgi:Inositol 1,3,4-trisphosphate 5/6-kinase ATP-grasp domain